MSGTRTGFVATKPLQLMTSMVLARSRGGSGSGDAGGDDAILMAVPNFADAHAVIGRLARMSSAFGTVRIAHHPALALLGLIAAGADRVFLPSDVGLKTPLAMRAARLLRPGLRFALYEEGVSLVQPVERDRPGRLSERLGATMELGADPLTEEVWVYSTLEAVRARLPGKRVRRIEPPLATFVADERELLSAVFWPTLPEDRDAWRGRRCRLYLSSWQVDHAVLDELAASSDYTVCKLHPHLRDAVELPAGIDQVPDPSIPAELLVLELAAAFDEVDVLHHDSSTARYLQLPNVRFVHLPDPPADAAPTPAHGVGLDDRSR